MIFFGQNFISWWQKKKGIVNGIKGFSLEKWAYVATLLEKFSWLSPYLDDRFSYVANMQQDS
jgi:hypothetical protein